MKTTITGTRQVARGTMEFALARPEALVFEAGHTIDLTLVNPPETDVEGNRRTFSILSAPHEPELRIATRIRDSAFKRVLAAARVGTEVELEGPFGSYTLHENAARPAVFLAGGIGITPFHAMAADAAARNLPHRLILFYSSRRKEDAAYLEELERIAAAHPRFTFVPTLTADDPASDWNGERGRVDAAMLARHIPAGVFPVYYLAGPQRMVLATRDLLAATGVSRDDIRYEEFSGY
ncbi:MAG TPA: FAD-dependent oxidoreductase [Candidatus Paceibacterota bacterium]|nr:FAD-dependent oxidoreductase [Candidatus Paceibacterota bacterium]